MDHPKQGRRTNPTDDNHGCPRSVVTRCPAGLPDLRRDEVSDTVAQHEHDIAGKLLRVPGSCRCCPAESNDVGDAIGRGGKDERAEEGNLAVPRNGDDSDATGHSGDTPDCGMGGKILRPATEGEGRDDAAGNTEAATSRRDES